MCHGQIPYSCRGQKGASDILELKTQVVVSYLMIFLLLLLGSRKHEHIQFLSFPPVIPACECEFKFLSVCECELRVCVSSGYSV